MKPGISVDKVTKKVKKTVKRADNRIKDFNKFITGKVADFSKVKLPEPVTFFKAKAFIKSLDRLQGAKGSGSSGFGGGFMDKMLPIAAGSALLTMGALAFAPPTEAKGTTETVLQEQYGGDKNKMKRELSAEKKKAEEGQKTFDDVAEQRKTNIDKTVKNLASVKSNQPKSLTGGLMKKDGHDTITKKEKLDVDKFYKLSKELEQLVDSGILMRAMGPSFWEWSGDRARDMWEGTKRITGGTLDALTFNWFDFDKKNEPEKTVDKDGFPRADGALDEENFSKIKLNYIERSNDPNKKHDEDNYDRDGNKVNIGDRVGYPAGSFQPTSSVFPSNETLISSTGGTGGLLAQGTGGATFGETGNVSQAAGWVHGHFQTLSGTANDVIKDVLPIVEKLVAQGVPTELENGQKFEKGMSREQMTELIKLGIQLHDHSGDGRSVDIFVPEGTKVPVALIDVRRTADTASGVSGILPGTGHTWVGHLTPDSKSGPPHPPHSSLPPADVSTTLPDQKSGVVPMQVAQTVPEQYPSYNKTKRGIVNNNTYLITQTTPAQSKNAVVVSGGGNQGGIPPMQIIATSGAQMEDFMLSKLGNA